MAVRALHLLCLVLCVVICSCRYREKIKVRLQGGTQPYSGRVQVYHRGIWGGVCDNGWSHKNAMVICRQLRYKGVVLFTKGMFYGRQTGRYSSQRIIWLDRVECGGWEQDLSECRHKPWGHTRCSRTRLAGVMCDPGREVLTKQPPLANVVQQLDIKLFKIKLEYKQSGETASEGVLKVKYGTEKWGLVCSDGWDTKEARVACGQLGFTYTEDSAHDGSSWQAAWKNVFVLSKVQCTGSEASLLSCDSSGLKFGQYCESGMPVSLRCVTHVPKFKHARLRGGVLPTEGRVEVRLRRYWGSLCDKNMDINTANVICRTLGYGTAYEYTLGTVFPHGMTQKIYENIQCTGKEMLLHNCQWKSAARKYPCKHYSDVGVRCNVLQKKTMDEFKVRLVGMRRDNAGMVEVNMNEDWGMVCGDRWSMKNAMVVCRQLGQGYAKRNFSRAMGNRTGMTMMSGVTCLGHETSLDQCLRHSLDNVTCSSLKSVAGVECHKAAPDLVWDVKELTKTMRIDYITLGALQCAYDEKCLASTADLHYTYDRWRHQRRLLRFSAKVHNVGTAAYRPYQSRSSWQYHTCHRHYHSDEEFALYDLINENHKKVAEGHKASYCLEDTVCDEGVDKFYNCTDGGAQGISVHCHDNYDYTLDCQWVDVTDLPYKPLRTYILRIVANPSLKVAESDYSNNVALCKYVDYGSYVVPRHNCFLERCKSGVRSHHGAGNFACCHFPFVYEGESHSTCLEDEETGQFWCSTTSNYDVNKSWGYC